MPAQKGTAVGRHCRRQNGDLPSAQLGDRPGRWPGGGPGRRHRPASVGAHPERRHLYPYPRTGAGVTRTTCPYCGVGCGVSVADGVTRGDEAHPANFGRLCSKGAALSDTLALPDRLTVPTIDGKDATWDAALDLIAGEFSRIREEHGPEAIAFYVSGQFLTEDYYVAN